MILFLRHALQGFLRLHAKARQIRECLTQKIEDAERISRFSLKKREKCPLPPDVAVKVDGGIVETYLDKVPAGMVP